MTKEEIISYLLGEKGDMIISIFPTTKGIQINRIASEKDSLVVDASFQEAWDALTNAEQRELLISILYAIIE